MIVFIYGETDEAIAIRDAEKGKGNDAFLRNPEYFGPDANFNCDKAVTWDAAIAEAFKAKGKAVDFLGGVVYTEADAIAQNEDVTAVEEVVEEVDSSGESLGEVEKPVRKGRK